MQTDGREKPRDMTLFLIYKIKTKTKTHKNRSALRRAMHCERKEDEENVDSLQLLLESIRRVLPSNVCNAYHVIEWLL